LNVSIVNTTIGDSTHELARDAGFDAARDISYTVVLGSNCNEVVDWRIVAPLNIGA
jgi:hypothetical protein